MAELGTGKVEQKSSIPMQIQTKILAPKSLSTVEHQKRPRMAVEMVGVMDMVGGIISRIITGVVEPQKHPKVRVVLGVENNSRYLK